MRTSSLIALAMCLSSAVAWTKPKFCKSLDCPRYEVVANLSDTVEIRRYEAVTWVSGSSTGTDLSDYKSAVGKAFGKLFKYISGANVEQKKVEMATPVQTVVTPGEGPACATTFTTSFFTPFANQPNPPKPTDETLFVDHHAEITVAVQSFSGFAMDWSTWQTQFATLDAALEAHNITTYQKAGPYITNVYDSPFTLFGRHNEAWLIVN